MKIDCLPARQLTADLASRWHEILALSPHLAGPYFRPEFTAAVAAVRDDVELVVIEEAGEVVGFFPFQRTWLNAAVPVGGKLSDYQGVIAAPEVAWQPAAILSACRLGAWEFDHQLASQSPLRPHFDKIATSPVIDLAHGHEAWLTARKTAYGALKETLRKMRKLERESDGVTFEWHTNERAVFEQLLDWKSAQYARTGVSDIFRQQWVVALLERLRTMASPHLTGVLSVLRVGGKLAAIHLGMQSGGTLHSWFPAYDRELSRWSLGQVLLLRLAEQSAEHGIRRIDLGKGTEDYKLALASDFVEVAEGCLDRRPLASTVRRGWTSTRDWVKRSPLGAPAKASIQWLRRMSERLGRKQPVALKVQTS